MVVTFLKSLYFIIVFDNGAVVFVVPLIYRIPVKLSDPN